MQILDNIRVSIEEKNEIKKDSPDSLPLNATAQGYSGQEVRRRLSKSLVGEEGSLLRLVIDKMEILSSLLHSILDESDENSIIEQLNKKLSLDGSLAMNGELDLGLNKIIQVLKGTSIKDAANMQNIEDQLPRDGSRPMLSDLDLNGNEIKRVHDIEFHNGGVIGNFLGNAIHITIPTGETLIFYEEGLDLFSRKLLRVAKGVNSKDGANMENIAEVLLDSKTYADGKLVDKLDKNFDILTEQSILNLTDSIVINRGNVPYKTSLTNLLARMGGGDLFIVVATLPETGLPNKIYLVPKSENDINSVPQIEDEDENDNNNELDEYVWIENGWERIGGVSVDLSNYYDKDQVDVLLVNKLDKNIAITGATKTKITYDTKGLVTAGEDLTADDIPQLAPSKITQDANNRFVTDTEKSTWNAKSNFSGSYNNLTNKPTLFSGSYSDLTNKPTIPVELKDLTEDSTHRTVSDTEKSTWNAKSTFSGNYNDLTNKPTLSTVTTSGEYSDLSGRPNLDLKLDKDFSALPAQTNPLLTDVLVLNRGTTVQKVTLSSLLAHIDTELFIVVSTLPTTGVVNKIYLVPKGTPETQNTYDEFIWAFNEDTEEYGWERIGIVSIDLSNYYTKSEANELLEDKVDKNANITAGTKTKITYDSKGLVTAGADLSESDIPTLSPSKITQDANNRFVTDTEKSTWNGKQDALTNVTTADIVTGTATAQKTVTAKAVHDAIVQIMFNSLGGES